MTSNKEKFYISNTIDESLLTKTNRELEILKKEINDALCHSKRMRYFIDFEKNEFSYNPKKVVKNILIKEKEPNLRALLERSEDYFREIENLPMKFVLKGTNKVVFTEEWIEAINERKNLNILKKINYYRKKKIFENYEKEKQTEKFTEKETNYLNKSNGNLNFSFSKCDDFKTNENHNSRLKVGQINDDLPTPINQDDNSLSPIFNKHMSKAPHETREIPLYPDLPLSKRELACKLAYEAKNFVEQNTIYEDEDVRILDFPCVFTYSKEIPVKKIKKPQFNKKIFDVMRSENSKANFKVPNIKKKGACHASHAAAFSKISYEFSKLSTPLEILNFKSVRNNNNNMRQ